MAIGIFTRTLGETRFRADLNCLRCIMNQIRPSRLIGRIRPIAITNSKPTGIGIAHIGLWWQ